jgi:hypothetical protein
MENNAPLSTLLSMPRRGVEAKRLALDLGGRLGSQRGTLSVMAMGRERQRQQRRGGGGEGGDGSAESVEELQQRYCCSQCMPGREQVRERDRGEQMHDSD